MLLPRPDAIPYLSDTCSPPVVLGTAVLTTAAVHGAGPDALIEMIDRLDAGPIAQLYDTSIAYQLAFRRAEALGLQDDALAASQLYRVRREGQRPTDIRLLALMAPGDLMVNTPLDFITNHLDVRLDLLFLLPDEILPAIIPDHDIMFMAASEAEPAALARMRRLFDVWPRPVLNNPRFLPALARDKLAELLADVLSICSPPSVEVSRRRLEELSCRPASIGDLLPDCSYPILLRPAESHAGAGLKKIEGPAELASYLLFSFAKSFSCLLSWTIVQRMDCIGSTASRSSIVSPISVIWPHRRIGWYTT